MTPLRFSDYGPVFTKDGKHLAFLSVRTFDPVYDAHVFDLSFPTGCRPYLVPLRATTPSPFDPSLQGRGFNGEDDQPPADDKQKDDAPPRTEVDPEGLQSRVVPVPVPAANYGNLRTAKDALIWLRHPLTGRLGDGSETTRETVLERYDLKKRAKSELGKEFKRLRGERRRHPARRQRQERPADPPRRRGRRRGRASTSTGSPSSSTPSPSGGRATTRPDGSCATTSGART